MPSGPGRFSGPCERALARAGTMKRSRPGWRDACWLLRQPPSRGFFKKLCLFSASRFRVAWARRLDRPTDRLQCLPAALLSKLFKPKLIGHEVRNLSARPYAAIRRRLLEPNLQLFQKLGLEHPRARAIVAAKIPERPRAERVVARQQLLDPARHKTRQRRHRRDRVALRQKPDRLVVPRRARILTRAITLLQLLNAEMIRHMRHDPPSRDSWRSNLTASHPKRNPTRVNQPETVSSFDFALMYSHSSPRFDIA